MRRLHEGDRRIPAITGIGRAVGRIKMDNAAIDGLLGRKVGFVDRAMRMNNIGIQTRYWVAKGPEGYDREQASSDLSAEALVQAIEMAGIPAEDLKRIIVATSSPDYMGVPVAAMVQDKLGLPTNVQAYDIAAACAGWVQALNEVYVNLMSPLGKGGPQAVVGAEVLSPVISKKKLNTFILFGDAAGATIVDLVNPDDGAPTNMAFVAGADGSLAEKLNVPAGGSKYPPSQYTIDHDMHSMDMDGTVIKDNAINRMVEVTQQALEEAGVPLEEVALFIPHQANLSIIEGVADSVGMPMERVMVTIDRYGNTSAAAIPTALRDAWDQERIKRNDIMVVVTFGAGLEYIAGVLPMVGLPRR